jgi:ribose-phosphate pyrophosphokinase
MSPPLLFALKSASDFGHHIARRLDRPLQEHEERDFEDGEHKIRPLVDVEGGDVYLVAGLHGDGDQSVNDRLCRALFFVGALRDAGAARVTVLAPYLCYARKDRRTQPRDPVTTRYVAQLFEAMRVDRMVTMEVHNLAAFQNAFRVPTTHLVPYEIFSRHVMTIAGDDRVVVVSPDLGGAKRADLFRQSLEASLGRPVSKAVADKQRSLGRVTGDLFMGDVAGTLALLLDDLVSTGGTMARVARQCRERGAGRVVVMATHGVGGVAALDNLAGPDIEQVILSNTVPQSQDFVAALGERLTILDVSEAFARALRHGGHG